MRICDTNASLYSAVFDKHYDIISCYKNVIWRLSVIKYTHPQGNTLLMVISILKVVLVIVTLAGMILLLIGMNHFFSGNFDITDSEIDDMRRDVEGSDDVITERSVFRELVEAPRTVDGIGREVRRKK